MKLNSFMGAHPRRIKNGDCLLPLLYSGEGGGEGLRLPLLEYLSNP